MAAIALLLALFRVKPSPFCVLDEVDAPLDEANGARFNHMLKEMSRIHSFSSLRITVRRWSARTPPLWHYNAESLASETGFGGFGSAIAASGCLRLWARLTSLRVASLPRV